MFKIICQRKWPLGPQLCHQLLIPSYLDYFLKIMTPKPPPFLEEVSNSPISFVALSDPVCGPFVSTDTSCEAGRSHRPCPVPSWSVPECVQAGRLSWLRAYRRRSSLSCRFDLWNLTCLTYSCLEYCLNFKLRFFYLLVGIVVCYLPFKESTSEDVSAGYDVPSVCDQLTVILVCRINSWSWRQSTMHWKTKTRNRLQVRSWRVVILSLCPFNLS